MKDLAESLKGNHSLKSLDLKKNKITKESSKYISYIMNKLTKLDICKLKQHLTTQGMKELKRFLNPSNQAIL